MRTLTLKLFDNQGEEVEKLTLDEEIENSRMPEKIVQDVTEVFATLVNYAEGLKTYDHYKVVLEVGEK